MSRPYEHRGKIEVASRCYYRRTRAKNAPWLPACDGYYERKPKGILLMNQTGEPFAFVAQNGSSVWLVTAFRHTDGRTYYMNALTEESGRRLGIEDPIGSGWRRSHEVARSITDQVAAHELAAAA